MPQVSQSVLPVADALHLKKAKKATGVAAFGTFIEYYDFSVFGYVAATIAVVFFPSGDPVAGLLNTFLVFGTAFLVRPLGAIFFGRIGDRYGRRASLIGSVILMSAAAGLTALLPTYAQIGIWAPDPAGPAQDAAGPFSRRRDWRCRHLYPRMGSGGAPEPLHLLHSQRWRAGQGRRCRNCCTGCDFCARGRNGVLGLEDPVPARDPAGHPVPDHAFEDRGQPGVHPECEQGSDDSGPDR